MKKAGYTTGLCLIVALGFSSPTTARQGSTGAEVLTDIPYVPPDPVADPEGRRTFDYYPPRDFFFDPDYLQNYPPSALLIYAHGGGFTLGNKRQELVGSLAPPTEVGQLLPPWFPIVASSDPQVAIASIGYRLVSVDLNGYHNAWPTPYDDFRDAIEFIRASATALHVDPNKIFVLGNSAGSVMAAKLVLEQDMSGPVHVNGAILNRFPTHLGEFQLTVPDTLFGDCDVLDPSQTHDGNPGEWCKLSTVSEPHLRALDVLGSLDRAGPSKINSVPLYVSFPHQDSTEDNPADLSYKDTPANDEPCVGVPPPPPPPPPIIEPGPVGCLGMRDNHASWFGEQLSTKLFQVGWDRHIFPQLPSNAHMRNAKPVENALGETEDDQGNDLQGPKFPRGTWVLDWIANAP